MTELLEKLNHRGYFADGVQLDNERVEVTFNDPTYGRLFAGSLLNWGLPRTFKNNHVNATVSFSEFYMSRILELL